MEVEQTVWDMARDAAHAWFRAQCANCFAHFHLYYQPSRDKEWGRVVIAENAPDSSYQLATSQRISPAWTEDKAKRFCAEIMRRLPLLPTA